MDRVYFILTECCRYVKIGVSNDPVRRWHEVKVGTPMNSRLLGSLPGGRLGEKLLHDEFWDLRAQGEWFELRGSLKAYLEAWGLLTVTYSERDPKIIQQAKTIRRAGWRDLTHDQLDLLISEPERVWEVYYSKCDWRCRISE